MKPATPLQIIVDPFVRGIQGELVSELVGNDNPPSSADYLFRQHNVIAELKALETDSFGESFRRKLGERAANWQRQGKLRVYGTTRIDSHKLSLDCQHEPMELMAAPLQRIVKAADAQIASTKEILGLPGARDHPGLVCIFSAMEPCSTYKPWHNKQSGKTYLVPNDGKCLHYYFYFVDEELGFCHVRVPTWLPCRLQICLNGHNWLAGRLR